MSLSDFITLWKHRYRKYTYIAQEYVLAFATIVRFLGLKLSFWGRKKLVAIIRTEHFGDIVAAEPLARQVREAHPNDYIVWVVKPSFKELVATHPAINEAWAQPTVLRRLLVFNSGVFDKIYNLEFWQSNLDAISGRVHKNEVAEAKDITVFNYFEKGNLLTIFQLCAELPVKDDVPQLYIPAVDKQKIANLNLPQKLIVIHCSSNYPAKDWSVPNWEKLIYWLTEDLGYTVVEIGLKSKNSVRSAKYIDACGKYSLLQTAEIIRRAEYFIGIDSGPAHLANAVGTYGILLFGKLNNFDTYMPYSGNYQNGRNARLLWQTGKTCSALEYQWVRGEIEAVLAKSYKAKLTVIS